MAGFLTFYLVKESQQGDLVQLGAGGAEPGAPFPLLVKKDVITEPFLTGKVSCARHLPELLPGLLGPEASQRSQEPFSTCPCPGS